MSSVPQTMKAVVVKEVGGPEKLVLDESYPVPKPGDGQILVKNKLAGINFIDTYFRSGLYPSPGGLPTINGQEGSGTIVAIGPENKLGFKEGDRVLWNGRGGYAEYTATNADKAVLIPDGVSDEDAVGSFLMGMTALSLIQEAYPVKKGQTVLVHAAAGGVGLLMCQMLRDIGAVTIGTAGGPEKCALAKENGATHMIDYRSTEGKSWVEQVKDLTDGQGVDVVYDSVGKDTWQGSLEAVRRKGKVIYFGNASGPIPPLQVQTLSSKNITIMRATVMQYIVTREEFEYYADAVLALVKAGKLNIRQHKTYKIEDAVQIHKDLESRKTSGKLYIEF